MGEKLLNNTINTSGNTKTLHSKKNYKNCNWVKNRTNGRSTAFSRRNLQQFIRVNFLNVCSERSSARDFYKSLYRFSDRFVDFVDVLEKISHVFTCFFHLLQIVQLRASDGLELSENTEEFRFSLSDKLQTVVTCFDHSFQFCYTGVQFAHIPICRSLNGGRFCLNNVWES